MKMILRLLAILIVTSGATFAEEIAIPKDSKSEWDFRGKLSPFLMGSPSASKLPKCTDYEELRDTLKKVIPELLESPF